ncbi:uncharacterized protein LOC112873007 [Panicum hallii]|uniref:uncharacterized protein LOC112873007 n=1 Tax=Panicum hallii TaxID=206008 RepID=UPI000DF4E3CC|nr:uncharacterized protein LOC112873007 [Panicum hallii]
MASSYLRHAPVLELREASARKTRFLWFLHLREGQEPAGRRELADVWEEAERTRAEAQSLKEALANARSEVWSARAEADVAKASMVKVACEAAAAKASEAEAARAADAEKRGVAEVEAREKGLAEARAKRLEESECLVEALEGQLRSVRADSEDLR